MNSAQEYISIPVAYIEVFVMMLGAFLIGYIGCYLYYSKLLKRRATVNMNKERSLNKRIRDLQDELDSKDRSNYQKDRMDQDYEQIQFQQRAFSNRILNENIESSPKINFEVIGHASQDEKDNLQEINGIGPYTEAKLNDLGIFTFAQISKFTEEDIATVTELIKFFPDRIKNDQWVGKARNLVYNNSNSTNNEQSGESKKKMTYEKTTR